MRVFNAALAFIGEIDNYKSMIVTRKYRGIETLEMTIPLSDGSLLDRGVWLWLANNKIFRVVHRRISGNPLELSVTAWGPSHLYARRITIPPSGSAQDTHTGSHDAIVKHFIDSNIVNPTDSDRNITYMLNAAAQAGTSSTASTRYNNLHDKIIEVLAAEDRGYFFTFNGTAKTITFDTYTGTDRTDDNGVNPPAIFSVGFDNIIERDFIDSESNTINYSYTGGQGEAAARTISEIGTATGATRAEIFVDARDTDNGDELDDRGTEALVDNLQSFSATINPSANLTYETDYDLGDTVTITDTELGLTLDARITQVQEVYQQGAADTIAVTFGNTTPTFLNTVKHQNTQINRLGAV